VNAAVIGAAEATLNSQPELWRDWGSLEETLQYLKQLLHVVVHYGIPLDNPPHDTCLERRLIFQVFLQYTDIEFLGRNPM
jgi:hypothetical protein